MPNLRSFVRRYLIVGLVGLVVLVALVPALDLGVRLPATGEQETLTARVVEVLEERPAEPGVVGAQPYQRLRVRVEGGSLAGQELVVEEGTLISSNEERLFDRGDRVFVERMPGPEGDRFYISDLVRTGPLLFIAGLFAALVLFTGRGKGLRSLVGTLFSLLVIFSFVVPQVLAGRDPLAVSILGAIVLLAVSSYLINGWCPKAHAALAGMTLSLVLTGVLAWVFVGWVRLSGLASEEGTYLMIELGPAIKLQRLVLGGIIIGSLGVLDDICVGQASAVFELARANPRLRWPDLFRHSLNIGEDHVAATVNTLLLAYVGASLPLMLIFAIYQEPLLRRLSREPIAEEIIRTLVGSMGLVLAMPITSLIASLVAHRVARGAGVQAQEAW